MPSLVQGRGLAVRPIHHCQRHQQTPYSSCTRRQEASPPHCLRLAFCLLRIIFSLQKNVKKKLLTPPAERQVQSRGTTDRDGVTISGSSGDALIADFDPRQLGHT
jgi:hypothetical protein